MIRTGSVNVVLGPLYPALTTAMYLLSYSNHISLYGNCSAGGKPLASFSAKCTCGVLALFVFILRRRSMCLMSCLPIFLEQTTLNFVIVRSMKYFISDIDSITDCMERDSGGNQFQSLP